MRVHAKARAFDDPGVLRLKESAWSTWHLFAPKWRQGDLSAPPKSAGKPRIQADPEALAKALAELGG